MKKILTVLLISALFLSLMGCYENFNGNDTSSGIISSSESHGSTTDSLDEDGIKHLMTENINCMYNIFVLDSLPHTEQLVKDNIYQVNTDKFKNYSEFENYIKSVYTAEFADTLLNNYPYEGVSKYLNIDGKLCINLDYCGGKGYYVDWSEYSVKILSCNEEICEFNLTASIEEPAEIPTKAPYNVKATAKFENGKWLLTKMVY